MEVLKLPGDPCRTTLYACPYFAQALLSRCFDGDRQIRMNGDGQTIRSRTDQRECDRFMIVMYSEQRTHFGTFHVP